MKSIKKKIILAALVCAFSFSSMILPEYEAYAVNSESIAASETNNSQIQFSLEKKTVTLSEAADTVKLSLVISDGSYINQGTFKFTYNSNDLELTDISNGSGVTANEGIVNKDTSSATYSLFCDNVPSNPGASGELAVLTFRIKNPSAGSVYPVTVSNSGKIIRFLSSSADNDLVLEPSFDAGCIEISPESQQSGEFEWGKDNWQFKNSDDYFDCYGDYYISDEFLNKLLSKCSNTEKESVRDLKSSGWGGSCYGLATLSVLAKNGIFNVPSWQNGASYLHDINAPAKDNTESLINYYFLTQVLDYIQQDIDTNFFRSESDKLNELKKLCDNAETTGKPVLFCFHGYFYGFSWGGHAITAYANESESGTVSGFNYTGYIKMYDNNSYEYSPEFNLYYNDSGNWYIPAYEVKSADGGVIGIFTDNAEYLNKCGYFDSSFSAVSDNGFIGEIRTAASDRKFSLKKVNADGSPSFNSAIDDDEIRFSSDMLSSSENNNAVKALLKDTASGYLYTPDTASAVDLTMRYEDIRMKAVSDSASSVQFLPDGCIEISSDSSKSDMQMTLNKNLCDLPWYTIDVSVGNPSDKAVLSKTDGGYILEGDNLGLIKVSAHNDDVKASAVFSTDSSSVFIYSIDENTIGISADKDGDGKFETDIDTYMNADVNSDNEITSLDALMILQNITASVQFSDMQSYCADVDGDGAVTSADALKILQYVVGNDVF